MQSTQFEIKYIREALCSLIDKILPYIEHKSIHSFCKTLYSKILDDKMTPYAIYLETQKISESSDNSSRKVLATTEAKFNYSVLQKIKLAQGEFKHDTEQMASIFNSVKENVESVYVSSEELKNMMSERDRISSMNVREEKIRRVSLYKKQKEPEPIMPENKIEFKYEIQDVKQAIKSEPRIEYKQDNIVEVKTDSKKLIEQKKETSFETKLVQSNQKSLQNQFSSSQKHISIPSQQQQYPQSSLNPSPIKQFSYIQTPPHSFNQLSQQKQQQQPTSQFMFTQPNEPTKQQQNGQQQNQIGSYVPNYDLLARVDQLLQKSKNSALTQVNTPCLTNRI